MNTDFEAFTELRAEEVQEIMTRPPSWLLRWGSIVVGVVLVAILTGAWWLHYPDMVQASFRLTSTNAPRAVLTRSEGKLTHLLVSEGEMVKANTPLAFLESTAHPEDVMKLSNQLTKAWSLAHRGHLEGLAKLKLENYGQLGEVQIAYQTFVQAYIQLRAFLVGGFATQKKSLLQQEIADFGSLANNLRQQQVLQARDVALAEDDYAIHQRLAEQRVIAPLDLKREEGKLLARRMPLQQINAALIQNQTQQRIKAKEILELDRQVAEERDKFLQSLNTLQSAVDGWKQKYVLTSPVSGQVTLVGILQEQQSVFSGQELFYVSPPNTEHFGELRIPQRNAGKVQVGQTVVIRFTGYPYREFGAVYGRIAYISPLPYKDSVFIARVILPKGLQTTNHIKLNERNGMTASADIITSNTRLLQKLFNQIKIID